VSLRGVGFWLPNTETLRDCFGEGADVNLETLAGLAKTKIKAELIDEWHQKTQSKAIAADEIIVELLTGVPGSANVAEKSQLQPNIESETERESQDSWLHQGIAIFRCAKILVLAPPGVNVRAAHTVGAADTEILPCGEVFHPARLT